MDQREKKQKKKEAPKGKKTQRYCEHFVDIEDQIPLLCQRLRSSQTSMHNGSLFLSAMKYGFVAADGKENFIVAHHNLCSTMKRVNDST